MKRNPTLKEMFRGFGALLTFSAITVTGFASSHREVPLISTDPLADNTDLYAFRCPDDTYYVTIIANYIPFQLPEGGQNYATFGTDIRYESNKVKYFLLSPPYFLVCLVYLEILLPKH